MFCGAGAEDALFILRKMIHAGTEEECNAAIDELAPVHRCDIKATLEAMDGPPVTVIRLLDPPLHEFVPHEESVLKRLAEALKCSVEEVKQRGQALHEVNPMMGHRGVRLGITHMHLTEMQIRAILEAAAELKKAGKNPKPEIMVPVTCTVKELDFVKPIFDKVRAETGFDCLYGTMIEIPARLLPTRWPRPPSSSRSAQRPLADGLASAAMTSAGSSSITGQRRSRRRSVQTIDQEGIGSSSRCRWRKAGRRGRT